MKQLIDLVNKSFVNSEKLKTQKEKVAELKMGFVSKLSDEQCIRFLEFWVEVEDMIKNANRRIYQTYSQDLQRCV